MVYLVQPELDEGALIYCAELTTQEGKSVTELQIENFVRDDNTFDKIGLVGKRYLFVASNTIIKFIDIK